MKKVVVITGPTAVGKSKIALSVAKIFNTELINGDAYQIYQKMNIGTAKPTIEELKIVKHHLCDFLDPLLPFSIYDYQKEVRNIIDNILSADQLPLIVGGTGLYIDSVIYNYRFDGEGRDDLFEQQFEHLSNDELHQLLSEKNKITAEQIPPNNRKRVLRALSLCVNENNSSERQKKDQLYYQPLIIFLDDERKILYEKINERVDEMMKGGLLYEVERLYPNHLSIQARKAIGYNQLFQYLSGAITLPVAIETIKTATRRYAKRQWTWYRKHPHVTFVKINHECFAETIEEVITVIKKFLIS